MRTYVATIVATYVISFYIYLLRLMSQWLRN